MKYRLVTFLATASFFAGSAGQALEDSSIHIYPAYYVMDATAQVHGKQADSKALFENRLVLVMKDNVPSYTPPPEAERKYFMVAREAGYMGGPQRAVKDDSPLYLLEPGKAICRLQPTGQITVAAMSGGSKEAIDTTLAKGCPLGHGRYMATVVEGSISGIAAISETHHIKINPEEYTKNMPPETMVAGNWFKQKMEENAASKHAAEPAATGKNNLPDDDARVTPFVAAAGKDETLKGFKPTTYIVGKSAPMVLFEKEGGASFKLVEMNGNRLRVLQDHKE